MWTTISYGLATAAVILIVAGLALARDRRRHIPLMLAAFGLDLIGLVIVEFVAPSVENKTDPVRSLADESMMSIAVIHAAFSTLTLVGYVAQIITGRKLMSDRSALAGHKRWAMFFVLMRLGAYVTMWMV